MAKKILFQKSAKEIKREKAAKWIMSIFFLIFLIGASFILNIDQVGIQGGIILSTWMNLAILIIIFGLILLSGFRRKKKIPEEPGLEFLSDQLVIVDGQAREVLSFYSVSDLMVKSYPNRPSSQIILGIRGKKRILQGYEEMEKIAAKIEKKMGKEVNIRHVSGRVDWGSPKLLGILLPFALLVSLLGLVLLLAFLEVIGLRRLFLPAIFILMGIFRIYYSWNSDKEEDEGVLSGVLFLAYGIMKLFLP